MQLASYASGCVLCGKLGPDYVTISDCYVQEGGCPPPPSTHIDIVSNFLAAKNWAVGSGELSNKERKSFVPLSRKDPPPIKAPDRRMRGGLWQLFLSALISEILQQ